MKEYGFNVTQFVLTLIPPTTHKFGNQRRINAGLSNAYLEIRGKLPEQIVHEKFVKKNDRGELTQQRIPFHTS